MSIFEFTDIELNDWKKEHKFDQSKTFNDGTAIINNERVQVKIIPPPIPIHKIPPELRQYAPGTRIMKIEKVRRLF